jgi:phage terminase large subunit-like protein
MSTVEALLREHLRRQGSRAFDNFRPYGWQLKWLNSLNKMVVALCANQVGKAGKLTEKVLTPDGWSTIGEMKVGSVVMTPDGGRSTVTGYYPQGDREVWKIVFGDGSTAKFDGEHLWRVKTGKARFGKARTQPYGEKTRAYPQSKEYGQWKIMTTNEIIALGGESPSPYKRCTVQPICPVGFDERALPIDPYLLGLLLGDGSMTHGSITITTADEEIVDSVRALADVDRVVRGSRYGWRLSSDGGKGSNNLLNQLRMLGLWGKNSHTKFIPHDYMIASVGQRLAMLQGLMDTDGTVGKRGCDCSFVSTSEQLAHDALDLARSLGMTANIGQKEKHCTYKGVKTPCTCYEVYFMRPTMPVFRLKRKLDRQIIFDNPSPRVMVRFERDGVHPCACITIDHPDKLFITSDYLPTHNSSTIALKASMVARCKYPDWYTGIKITDRAPVIFVVGLTSEEVRDSIQTKLIGPNIDDPTGGMIPPGDIIKITKRSNVPGAADTIFVKHPLGQAQICLKTAEQGRERLQGATVDLVIIDEEPPRDVLNELVARTAKANGQLCIGFTALKGMSDVYVFLTEQSKDVVEIIHASWLDAPHLSSESIRMMSEIYKDNPAELQARSTGIPTVGKGLIYPFPPEDYSGRLFKIRDHMRKLIAMDPGWTHPTAALIGAYDDDADILYIYDEHCQEAKPPAHHASAIKRWGNYNIVIDTAALQTNKQDGTTLFGMYEYEFDGPDWEQIPEDKRTMQIADNTAGSVMSGIAKVYQRFDEGRIYISENCPKLLAELKMYRYDEKTGKIVKKRDDLCDALRYLVSSLHLARLRGMRAKFEDTVYDPPNDWEPMDKIVGY